MNPAEQREVVAHDMELVAQGSLAADETESPLSMFDLLVHHVG